MEESRGLRKDLFSLTLILVLASLACAAFLLVRYLLSGKVAHSFLIWNLFLAWVPYLVAIAVHLARVKAEPPALKRVSVALLSLVWLLFYPNSPYIFTDFVHIMNRSLVGAGTKDWLAKNGLLWFDVILYSSFSFIGHFIGLFSIYIVQANLRTLWGRVAGWAAAAAAILLAGFGIYLGRFVRLNSWDLFLSPVSVVSQIAESTFGLKPILFSLTFSLFIAISYVILYIFKGASPLAPPDRPRQTP
jgi:uncharacterized membrane protein